MPVIRGGLAEGRACELRQRLLAQLPSRLVDEVVVNRLLLRDLPSNTVSVRASIDTEPEDVAVVAQIVMSCGIAVQPFTRVIVDRVPKLFGFTSMGDYSRYQRILVDAGIVQSFWRIPAEVTNLQGDPAPYLEAYCSHDSKLKSIEEALCGQVDLEIYYADGMRFFSKAA